MRNAQFFRIECDGARLKPLLPNALSHVPATRSAILQTSGDLKNGLQSRDKP
jgi:hypothetical protein